MKKMMIIAVMMGAMLMPAQMFAKNDRVNERPRVENNQKKKEIRIANERGNRPANKPNKKRAANYRPKNKPGKPGYRPGRPAPVVVVNRPAPRPCPPPPPPPAPRRYNYSCGAADAVTSFLSIVALMSIIAD